MRTPYRNDLDVLRDRLASLQEELAEIQARTHTLRELERTQVDLEKEIDAVRRRLEGIAVRRSLPLFDGIRVASPCRADWNDMVGDDRVRFCGDCGKNVFNVSAMARDEAEALVRETQGDVCIRLYRRADGTLLTSDCPVGVRKARTRKAAAATLAGGMIAASALVARSSAPPLSAKSAHVQPPAIEVTFEEPVHVTEPDPGRVKTGATRPMMGRPAIVTKIAPAPKHGPAPSRYGEP